MSDDSSVSDVYEFDDDSSVSFIMEEYDQSDNEVNSTNELEQDDSHVKIMFSFPSATTSGGIPTHRMKYQTLNVDDVQKHLSAKVRDLGAMLQLDTGKCLVLLLNYEWNDHKLLDDYMGSINTVEFFRKNGLSNKYFPDDLKCLLTEEMNENIVCNICYCGPEPGVPMSFFSLYGCGHKFCIDCYSHYIKSKNEESITSISCPFSDPKCNLKMTVSELKVISDYCTSASETDKKTNMILPTKLLSEDEIKQMYNLTSDDESDFESDDSIEQFEAQKANVNKIKENGIEELVYNFHSAMQKKEREETDQKHNRNMLARYWFNVSTQYCTLNLKKYKNCPFPDCDSVVEFKGFESDQIVSVDEQIDLLLIPLVRCGKKHQFCFSCGEISHSPCPCKVVFKWKQKCEDDSETLHWIQSNTKDCPKCHTIIEKNGGCNHMTCRSCHYQFCWVCLGDWASHMSDYRCDRFKDVDDVENEGVRASLERYMFYFDRFNNQRISHDKDREILEKFESKIRELQVSAGISWIETVFYKECITALLECRQTLKWSYAFLFYVPKCTGKQLIETAQWQLSNNVEQLSKLFADVPVNEVISRKTTFLSMKSSMLTAQSKLLEICIDIFADPTTLRTFKNRLKI